VVTARTGFAVHCILPGNSRHTRPPRAGAGRVLAGAGRVLAGAGRVLAGAGRVLAGAGRVHIKIKKSTFSFRNLLCSTHPGV
jgi:hypothetical protein